MPIYISTTGTTGNTLTQTAPTPSTYNAPVNVQVAGVALSSTVMHFDPSPDIIEIGLDVVAVSADADILMAYLTSVPIQFNVTTANTDRTLTIAAISAADIGKRFIVRKVDPGGSGKVIVDAPAGVYFVNSAGASTAGGTITSEASKYQSVMLSVISATLVS